MYRDPCFDCDLARAEIWIGKAVLDDAADTRKQPVRMAGDGQRIGRRKQRAAPRKFRRDGHSQCAEARRRRFAQAVPSSWRDLPIRISARPRWQPSLGSRCVSAEPFSPRRASLGANQRLSEFAFACGVRDYTHFVVSLAARQVATPEDTVETPATE